MSTRETGPAAGELANLAAVRDALRQAWSAATSSSSDWSTSRPSNGQCAVTSLILQDHFGGTLLRSTVSGRSHYWNRLPDGTELDLTKDQFPLFQLDAAPVERSRDYVLSFVDTRERYAHLRVDVEARLAG